jgi:hypothetical protein
MKRLLGAVLLKTVQDWNNPNYQLEIEEFMNSEWFEVIISGLELDANEIRSQLKSGTYRHVSMRAAYR